MITRVLFVLCYFELLNLGIEIFPVGSEMQVHFEESFSFGACLFFAVIFDPGEVFFFLLVQYAVILDYLLDFDIILLKFLLHFLDLCLFAHFLVNCDVDGVAHEYLAHLLLFLLLPQLLLLPESLLHHLFFR